MKQVDVFDVFEKNGEKSYAFSLVFENSQQTFAEEEINELMSDIIQQITTKTGAILK